MLPGANLHHLIHPKLHQSTAPTVHNEVERLPARQRQIAVNLVQWFPLQHHHQLWHRLHLPRQHLRQYWEAKVAYSHTSAHLVVYNTDWGNFLGSNDRIDTVQGTSSPNSLPDVFRIWSRSQSGLHRHPPQLVQRRSAWNYFSLLDVFLLPPSHLWEQHLRCLACEGRRNWHRWWRWRSGSDAQDSVIHPVCMLSARSNCGLVRILSPSFTYRY